MAQDINKYLVNDTIFDKINKTYIRMDSNDIKNQNLFLKEVFDKLINAMREQNPLFSKTFQKINWVGSFYKRTRVGQPEEYDVNFVINLPFKEKDLEFSTDRPGYIKIRAVRKDINSQYVLNLVPKAYNELNSLIDDQLYLNQQKFRTWIEGILSKVANVTSHGNDKIILQGYRPIKIRKSGPAFTLELDNEGRRIDIDVVPILSFSTYSLPPKCSKIDILQSYPNRCWSAVPKPLNNSRGDFGNLQPRYWRLCFYEFEKDIVSSHDYGRIKPVIRQLKKFRDTQRWTNVVSYYLETLCYHNLERFHISQGKSHTFLFFKMLEKLYDAFCNHCIKYYWDDDSNLLENIGPVEMTHMKSRLETILKDIRKDIIINQYAIAKWVLNKTELEKLKKSGPVTTPESELESQPESESESESNQWNCVII